MRELKKYETYILKRLFRFLDFFDFFFEYNSKSNLNTITKSIILSFY